MTLLGLPGNAVAAYVMYQLVARPLLGWMAGAGEEAPLTVQLPMAVDTHGKPGRVEWRRARFVQRYGGLALEPLKDQGSAMLRTLSEADALIAVPPAGVRGGRTDRRDAAGSARLDAQNRFISRRIVCTCGLYGGMNRLMPLKRDCLNTGVSLLKVSKPHSPW